jgi:hypothetical protein
VHIANHKEITALHHEHGMQWHAEHVPSPSCVHQWRNVQWAEFHCKGIMQACMDLMQCAAGADDDDATDVVVNFCETDAA